MLSQMVAMMLLDAVIQHLLYSMVSMIFQKCVVKGSRSAPVRCCSMVVKTFKLGVAMERPW